MPHNSFIYGGINFNYHLFRVDNITDTVKIHVNPNGSVQVDAPHVSQEIDIQKAVEKRARWIYKHIETFKKQRELVLNREYVSGETIFYLGKRYQLKVKDSTRTLLTRGMLFIPFSENITDRKTSVDTWYKQKAKKHFRKRLEVVSDELNWVEQTPKWKMRHMKKQWGSCSSQGQILLNPQLIKAPSDCIDYVILHELCHLKEHNHSPEFYKLLSIHMPQWKSVKYKLDSMSELILNDI